MHIVHNPRIWQEKMKSRSIVFTLLFLILVWLPILGSASHYSVPPGAVSNVAYNLYAGASAQGTCIAVSQVYGGSTVKCLGGDQSQGTFALSTEYVSMNNWMYTISGTSACTLLWNSSVNCLGTNVYGELGLQTTTSPINNPAMLVATNPASSVNKITSGSNHFCAQYASGNVSCWGLNNYGQLGQGDLVNRGGGSSDMGSNLPFINLGSNSTVSSLYSGGLHNCVITTYHTVICWGDNTYGQLGIGNTNSAGGTLATLGNGLPRVNLGTAEIPTNMALGLYHTCVLFLNSKVKCFGQGGFGALGYDATANIGDQANEMGVSLPFVALANIQEIAAGYEHTCVLFISGNVSCW